MKDQSTTLWKIIDSQREVVKEEGNEGTQKSPENNGEDVNCLPTNYYFRCK